MKEKVIRRTMALFLTAVLCTGLCTDFTVNAEEMDAEVKSQTEQVETLQKDDVLLENLPEASEEPEEQDEEQNEEVELSEETERKLSVRTSASGLSDPETETDPGMKAGQKVTWDCVWFGSYPQSEVASSDSVYSELQSDSGWVNNEITLNGSRYRRMKKEDATCSSETSGYYSWPNPDTYHYFKYEPIKWRVLKINGDQVLLLSDVTLDDQCYHEKSENVTWEKSTIRSWLNGYDASENGNGTDYSEKNFIGSAFTSGEQSAIVNTNVVNANNINNGTAGGINTSDRIFLLSESELYGDSAAVHGFVSSYDIFDEARRCKSSTYAKAMGVWSSTRDDGEYKDYKDNCHWWLRSPGIRPTCAAYVTREGYVYTQDRSIRDDLGVRAALNLNLNYSPVQWSYAGTVCSDGTVEDAIKAEEIKLSKTSIELTVGEKETLTAEILPETASVKTVIWVSEDSGIAKVDEYGTITAVSAGKTTVYCKTTDGSVAGKCDVLVKKLQNNPNNNPGNTGNQNTGNQNTGNQNTGNQNTGSDKENSDKITNTDIKVSKITLSGSSKKIAAGKKIKLTAEVTPSNAKNKAVTWKSSNTKVATVNSKGVVTLKKNSGGKKVTITATAKDGSKKKATYQITSMKGIVKKVVISGKKTRTLKAGKTLKLKAKVTVSNSRQANKTLKWSSSNTKYAKVSSKGVVKTYRKGKRKTVKITAMATDGSGKKYSINVKIK